MHYPAFTSNNVDYSDFAQYPPEHMYVDTIENFIVSTKKTSVYAGLKHFLQKCGHESIFLSCPQRNPVFMRV